MVGDHSFLCKQQYKGVRLLAQGAMRGKWGMGRTINGAEIIERQKSSCDQDLLLENPNPHSLPYR